MAERKACIQCGVTYEACAQYFHKAKDGGFHARCKKCRNKHERQGKKKKSDKKLQEIERGAVDTFIAASRIGGANIPHSSELLEVLMEYMGGVRGFANLFMKQLYDSPAGGAFRTKMLETVVRLVSNNTAMGGAKKPLTLWTEEELEDELRQRIVEAAITIQVLPHKEQHGELQNVPLVSHDSRVLGPVQEIPPADRSGGDGVPDSERGGG